MQIRTGGSRRSQEDLCPEISGDRNRGRCLLLSILQREDNVGKIRLRSQSGPMAGAWLSAIPSDQVFVKPDLTLAISVRLRLGIPLGLLREGTYCLCSSTPHGQSPVANDVHLLKCTLGAGVVARHNNIRDTIAWLGQLAGALVTVEPHRGRNIAQ